MQGLADGYFILPVHARQLPRGSATASSKTDVDERRRSSEAEADVARDALDKLLAHQGQALGRLVPPRARPASCGRTAAWRAAKRACTSALERDPRAARGVLAGRQRARRAATRSTRRSRRPAASPTSSSSASCSCRDALDARGELRRSLPRRAPDRRGEAKRDDENFRTRRRGSTTATTTAADPAAQRAARRSRTSSLATRSYK